MTEMIKKASTLKYRDLIYETVQEYNRSGEFIRIFPSKHSKQYEKYFSGVFGTRMLNRIVHKSLFSNEVLPYEKNRAHMTDDEKKQRLADPKNLKYAIDGVPQEQSYDHYKNRALQKQKSTKRNDSQKNKKDLAKNKASKESLQDSDLDTSALDQEEEKMGGQPKIRSTSTT
mmetsp:Transcript_9983/g.15088  ORF Transcript_9983/g.15088 Transcript_9983/m.15088 type:complete len:172 (-) Transcript_9983:760-1275(-)